MPAKSVARALRIVCTADKALAVIVQTPLVATALARTLDPSNKATVAPAVAGPVNVSVVSRVMLSEFDAPVSLEATRSGVETVTGEASIVTVTRG